MSGEMDRGPAPNPHSLLAVGGLLKRIAELERSVQHWEQTASSLVGERNKAWAEADSTRCTITGLSVKMDGALGWD